MFEHFTTLSEIARDRLGRAWSMENDIAALLGLFARFARDLEVGDLCRDHAEQSRTRADRVQACLDDLRAKTRTGGCPATKGLADEGKSAIRRCDDSIVDVVILSAVLECAHYQAAAYTALSIQASAVGAGAVQTLADRHRGEAEKLRDVVLADLPKITAALAQG